MPIRVNSAEAELRAFNAELERDTRQAIVALDQAVVSGTPVDTGQARANWFMDFGSVRVRTTATVSAPATSRGNGWNLGDGNVFIHNSVEHIVFLDEGSSAQAPQGILDPAIAAVRARFG